MRKRSETKPKRGFPLAAPPPPPRLEGLSGARLEGEGERLGGRRDPYDVVRCALPLNKGLETIGHSPSPCLI